jgi:two-component system, NarL family, response regulator
MKTKPIEVLLADDHAVVRFGLRAIIEGQPGFRVVAEAEDGEAAVELFGRHAPDVGLIDLRLPGCDGVAATTAIREKRPDAKILVLTSSQGTEDIYRALKAGAQGYLLKDVSPADLVAAIRDVHAGRRVIPPDVARRLAERVYLSDLSPREQEVLALLGKGLSNKDAAAALGLSENTVKTHVTHILGKLGVEDRTQAVMAAVQRGLIRPE